MTKTTKITKRDNYNTLRECVLDHMDWFEEGEADQLVAFIDKELENLDKRAANAKKYAAKNKASADALTEAALDVLTEADAYMTIPQIVAAINANGENADATPQKLTYRLSKLVEAGNIEKETKSIKEEGKTARKVNVYRIKAEEETAE